MLCCHKGLRSLGRSANRETQGARDAGDSAGGGRAVIIDQHLLHAHAGTNLYLALLMKHRRSDRCSQCQHKP